MSVFSVVCVGGDGTVSKVMNGIITKTQHDNDVEIQPHFGPAKATTPLGIIPVGKKPVLLTKYHLRLKTLTNFFVNHQLVITPRLPRLRHQVSLHLWGIQECLSLNSKPCHPWRRGCPDSLATDILAKIFVSGGQFGQIYNVNLYH